jgi:hypothetical protein
MLQKLVEHAILVLHGVALLLSRNVAKRLGSRRINAMRLVQKN